MRAEHLARILRPLRRAISSIVARAIVTLIDDSGGRQVLQLQVLDGELLDQIEHLQPLGISHVPMPPDGSGAAEAAVLFVGGSRSHGVAVVVDDRRYRPKGEAGGTTTIWTPAGVAIRILVDGTVQIMGPDIGIDSQGPLALGGASVTLDSQGDVNITAAGTLNLNGAAVMINGKLYEAHVHFVGPPVSANSGPPI